LCAERTACVGNGRNDELMIDAAALGIAVIQGEGAAVLTLQAADVAARQITEALDLCSTRGGWLQRSDCDLRLNLSSP
jgi:soluble P-type ATPase